jgi:hypothetical protein
VGDEVLGQPQVVADQPVAAQALEPLQRVGDGADRLGLDGERLGDGGFLLGFLHQRLGGRHAGTDSARDDVIELAGVERLVGRPPRHPQPHAVRPPHQTVDVNAGRGDAEGRQRAAVDLRQHRAVGIGVGTHVERLAPAPAEALRGDRRRDRVEGGGIVQHDAVRRAAEGGKSRQGSRQFRQHEADARGADQERQAPSRQLGVVAGADVPHQPVLRHPWSFVRLHRPRLSNP